jgi:hypothetical protein
MTRQDRKDPLLNVVNSHAARWSRQRSLAIGLGLVALSGTSLFAAIDQFHLRAASALIPCRTQEAKGPGLPTVTAEKFSAPIPEPATLLGPSADAVTSATPVMNMMTDPATETMPLPAPGQASVARAPQWNAAQAANATPDHKPVGFRDPESTGALARHRSASRRPGGIARPDTVGKTEWHTDCPLPELHAVLADISARFGPVTVVATHQQKTANHRSGSIRDKLHHDCKAVDFRAERSRIDEIKAYLRSRREIGGVESYRDGVIHMDASSRAALVTGVPSISTPDRVASH